MTNLAVNASSPFLRHMSSTFRFLFAKKLRLAGRAIAYCETNACLLQSTC
jgi:hypothetical protein